MKEEGEIDGHSPAKRAGVGRVLAVLQIVLGAVWIVLEAIGYFVLTEETDNPAKIAGKIAIGTFFVVTGSTSLGGAHKFTRDQEKNCLLSANFVLNIIAGILAAGLPIAALVVLFSGLIAKICTQTTDEDVFVCNTRSSMDLAALLALHISGLLIGVILLGISIGAAFISWRNDHQFETELMRLLSGPAATVSETKEEPSLDSDSPEVVNEPPPRYEENGLTFSKAKSGAGTEQAGNQHQDKKCDSCILGSSEGQPFDFTEQQCLALDNVWSANHYPDVFDMEMWAIKLHLDPAAVAWYFAACRFAFQRASMKVQQSS